MKNLKRLSLILLAVVMIVSAVSAFTVFADGEQSAQASLTKGEDKFVLTADSTDGITGIQFVISWDASAADVTFTKSIGDKVNGAKVISSINEKAGSVSGTIAVASTKGISGAIELATLKVNCKGQRANVALDLEIKSISHASGDYENVTATGYKPAQIDKLGAQTSDAHPGAIRFGATYFKQNDGDKLEDLGFLVISEGRLNNREGTLESLTLDNAATLGANVVRATNILNYDATVESIDDYAEIVYCVKVSGIDDAHNGSNIVVRPYAKVNGNVVYADAFVRNYNEVANALKN